MNEQINKLIYESGLIAQGCWDKFDEYDKQALNKFAELIVYECVNIIQNLPAGYSDYRDQIEDAFRNYSMLKIKRHFGVE